MEGGPNIQEIEASEETTYDGTQDNPRGCCDPRRPYMRFVALCFMCFLGFGSYFCYDNPAALEDKIKSDLNLTTTQYTMLYSFYSWPNVVLCFIGGFLIDKVFGIRLGTIVYMVLVLIGQLFFATGVYLDVFWVMIVGRFIFGIGAESLAVAQNNYAVLWFKGKELNMVFGLQLSFARIGSTVNFLIMGFIYIWVNQSYSGPECLGIVIFIATFTCILSLFCALILGVLDRRAERILRRNEHSTPVEVSLKDIKDFGVNFWLITIICVTYYISVFPFISLGKEFFIKKFHMSPQQANTVNSIVYLISCVASPVLGLVIDKVGKNVTWIFIAVSTTILSHCLLAFTHVNPYVGMVSMGVSYSGLASSLWPLVSLIVPEHNLGTAYGVCQSIQNLGLAVFAIVTGVLVEKYGYMDLEIFFICSLFAALATTVVLWVSDSYRGGCLNMSSSSRREYQERRRAADASVKDPLLDDVDNPARDETPPPPPPSSHQENDEFQIRNRYLSRIGAPVSDDDE